MAISRQHPITLDCVSLDRDSGWTFWTHLSSYPLSPESELLDVIPGFGPLENFLSGSRCSTCNILDWYGVMFTLTYFKASAQSTPTNFVSLLIVSSLIASPVLVGSKLGYNASTSAHTRTRVSFCRLLAFFLPPGWKFSSVSFLLLFPCSSYLASLICLPPGYKIICCFRSAAVFIFLLLCFLIHFLLLSYIYPVEDGHLLMLPLPLRPTPALLSIELY